jgi:hypothetical protein
MELLPETPGLRLHLGARERLVGLGRPAGDGRRLQMELRRKLDLVRAGVDQARQRVVYR